MTVPRQALQTLEAASQALQQAAGQCPLVPRTCRILRVTRLPQVSFDVGVWHGSRGQKPPVP